jgi:hypothetical protein
MCHADDQWTEALPLVLLGLRTAYKEDLQSSAAELVYGEPLRVPGELLVPAAPTVEAPTFVQQLRRLMDQLRPAPAARHSSQATFVHKDLRDATHVFLRQDATRRSLEPPYSGPHRVIARTDKTFKIVVRGREITVSTDRVKPAYILDGTHHGNGSSPTQHHSAPKPDQHDSGKRPAPANNTPEAVRTQPAKSTRSGRTVRCDFRQSYSIPHFSFTINFYI